MQEPSDKYILGLIKLGALNESDHPYHNKLENLYSRGFD